MTRHRLLGSLDPRMKIMSATALALAAALTPIGETTRFAAYAILLFVPLALSGFSFQKMIKRALLLAPLLVFLSLSLLLFKDAPAAQKIAAGGGLIMKAFLVSASFFMLALTTEPHQIIKAIERWKAAKIFTSLLFLAFRYLHVFARDLGGLRKAVESRSFGKTKRSARIKVQARMILLLLARSLERSQRVYAAMLSRGYNGTFETSGGLRFQRRDFIFGLVFFGGLVLTMVLG